VIEVELPDGRVIEVDAPDAQSAAAAARAFMQREAAPTPTANPVADQSRVTAPQPAAPQGGGKMRALQIGTQGAGAGLAELAALPFDLAAGAQNAIVAGINKLAGTSIPMAKPASSIIKDTASAGAEAIGVPPVDYESMSNMEKMAYNINRFGAQAAGAVPALASRAATRSAEIAAGSAPKAFDALVKPYAGENIGRTVVGDAAASAGAGTAVTGADIAGYQDNPLVQTLAALAGGVGGMTIPQVGERALRSGASFIGKPFGYGIDRTINVDPTTGSPVTKAISDRAALMVQDEAVNPADAARRIQSNADELRGLIAEPPMPTPAALSEDPGLAGLERKVAMNNQGPAAQRTREFNSAVRDTVDQVAPEGADPSALVRRVQSEADMRTAEAERQFHRAQGREERVADIRRDHASEVTPYAGRGVPASQRLDQTIVDRGYIPARTEKNARYNDGVPPETPTDLTGVSAVAQRIQQEAEALPPSFRNARLPAEQLNDLSQAGESTYDATRRMRMAVSDQRNQARAAGDFTRADDLRAVRAPLDAEMNRVNPGAAEYYQNEFAPVYRPGPGDEAAKFTKAIDRDPTRSATPPSETADRFIQPQAPEKQAALRRMIDASENPAAGQAAAREYLMSDLEASGVVDRATGALRPERLQAWQSKWGDLEGLVPGFNGEIAQLTNDATRGQRVAGIATERTQAAERNLGRTQSDIDKGAFGAVLNADPDKAVFAVMSKPDRSGRQLQQLIDVTADDPSARNGLKAAVRDYLVEKATTGASEKLVPGDRRGPVSQAKLSNIFHEHERELAQIFSPEEMNTLRAGHRALELANIERLRVTSGSDTAEKASLMDQFLGSGIGKGVEAALRLKYGVLKTGGIISTARRMTSGVTGGPDPNEVVRLVERAAYDPELMKLLLGRKVPIGSPAWNGRMQRLLAVGEGARDSQGFAPDVDK
jgi:hypothetical protein